MDIRLRKTFFQPIVIIYFQVSGSRKLFAEDEVHEQKSLCDVDQNPKLSAGEKIIVFFLFFWE